MKQKTDWLNVVKYAGAYIAFIIGSGFATGQEIIQFYTSYGIWGIGSIAISMFLFAWVGGTVTDMGFRTKGIRSTPMDRSAGNGLARSMSTSCVFSCSPWWS